MKLQVYVRFRGEPRMVLKEEESYGFAFSGAVLFR